MASGKGMLPNGDILFFKWSVDKPFGSWFYLHMHYLTNNG